MPDDIPDRSFDRTIDDLVNEAGKVAAASDWALSSSDIISQARRFPSRRVLRGVGVVLVAAAIVAVFVVPLPQLHLFGSGGTAPSSSTTSTTRPGGVARPPLWTGTIRAVHFLNASTGWVVTESPNRLLVTLNGGKSWRDVSPPGTRKVNVFLHSPQATITGAFLSRSTWWIAASWTSPRGPALTGPAIYVELYETTDAGRTWQRRGPKFSGTADALFFLDPKHGWLEADNGAAMGSDQVTIYGTSDGGSTWTELSKSASPVGQPGTPGALPVACDKQGLTFSTISTGWAAQACNGEAGELDRTDDAGRTWTVVSLGLVPGAAGGVVTWPPVFSSPSIGAVGLVVPGYEEAVYSTTNGGITWIEHRAPLTPAKGAGIDVISPTAWVIPEGTSIYATANAGGSWSTVRSSSTLANDEVDFTSVTNGWAWDLVESAPLLHTTDGGRSWVKVALTS